MYNVNIYQYVWRLYQRTRVDYGYPTHFRNLFSELPSSLGKIDALYERFDGNVVFFSGITNEIENK